MKPLNIDKTGCSNISSNCVSWQGPDIECIGLCKGDSVTEVVYKLALELCSLMDTFDLKNYDLQCFSEGVCQPQNFKDFLNILIEKVCSLQACNPDCINTCNPCVPPLGEAVAKTASTNMASHVPIAREFQYKNPKGDLVTSMAIGDYAQAVGNRVSSLVNSTKIVQDALSDHSKRLDLLEKKEPVAFQMPMVTPKGVLPKEAAPMHIVLAATEQQLTELKTAVGDQNKIYMNLQKQSSNINDVKSLSKPGTNMSGLRGWTANIQDQADAIGNMFVMIDDMRKAMTTIMTHYIPSNCDAISLDLAAVLKGSQLFLYLTGTLPYVTFKTTNGLGTTFTIKDNHGTVLTYVINIFDILNKNTGHVIDLGETRLALSDDLSISAEPNFTHTGDNSVCKSYLQYTLVNQGVCPTVNYVGTSNDIKFNFTTAGGTQAYTVELWNNIGSQLLQSATIMSNLIELKQGAFVNLDSNTLYKARVKMSVNGTERACEFVSVTTI